LEATYILSILKELKTKYKDDGFNLLALFGSYSTNTQNDNSDIDILYDVDNNFLEKYKGFKSVSKVLEIQNELSTLFHKKVDLTSPSGLSDNIRNDITTRAIYV